MAEGVGLLVPSAAEELVPTCPEFYRGSVAEENPRSIPFLSFGSFSFG
jgi:hypothetical protein